MSEEKLYAVKNDEGKYWDIGMPPWWDDKTGSVFKRIDLALRWAKKYDGHVVTLIEEPEKVVLSKEQAKIVEGAHNDKYPAYYISSKSNDEELLMNAYVNGYTVKKEKRYLVELDGLVTTDNAQQYLTNKNGKWFACRRMLGMPGMHQDFTDEELNKAPDWAQQLSREEVTDDEQ
jgi:predicted Zn-dependent peptidase